MVGVTFNVGNSVSIMFATRPQECVGMGELDELARNVTENVESVATDCHVLCVPSPTELEIDLPALERYGAMRPALVALPGMTVTRRTPSFSRQWLVLHCGTASSESRARVVVIARDPLGIAALRLDTALLQLL